MTNDVAIFLDLDNLVIGAKQANITFDIDLILQCIKERTNGRIVLRRSYGDSRQSQKVLEQLAKAGFTTQSTVRINNFSKNLADMQIVVDTMDTLVDGRQYSTYVLITGDRDFTPLVQALRKRGKHVIGVGIKHTASRSFVQLCDEYIFYEDMLPTPKLDDKEVRDILQKSLDELLKNSKRVRASVLKQRMIELSRGAFDKSQYGNQTFSKFLASFPDLVKVVQEGTTTYVERIGEEESTPLHILYRRGLKKQRLRVVAAKERYLILRTALQLLNQSSTYHWRQLVDDVATTLANQSYTISKNAINAVMLAARAGEVIRVIKTGSLATAEVHLEIKGNKLFQEAVVRCDAAYLRGILDLPEPFNLKEATLALYEAEKFEPYLKSVLENWVQR